MRYPAIALILMLMLSGCLDTLPPEKRLLCLDLTEKSYAFVPECNSEKECFSMLEKEFFSFDESPFSPESSNRLFSYKNKAALSWLNFNNARKSISALNEQCKRNSVSPELIFNLNELAHSLSKAFEFADSANRESFAILLIEKAGLEKEGISLVKEEPLFQDYTLISDNLNSFGNRAYCRGEHNYACFYLARAENFAFLVEQTGFEKKVLSEANAFTLLESQSKALSSYLGQNLKIPFVSSILPSFISYLSGASTSRAFFSMLETVPAFEFMQSYSGFMGTEVSCLEKFSAIMESDSMHRKTLEERNKSLEEKATQGISEAKASANSLLSENYTSFDQDFFQKLYSGLGQETLVSTQEFSIRDFGELKQDAGKKIQSLEQGLLAIREQSTLNAYGFGQKALALKELNNEISLLKDNLAFLEKNVLGGLAVLCDERAGMISTELDNAILPREFLVKASDLRAKARFRLAEFKKAGSMESKLIACRSMVDEHASFSQALEDFEQYSLMEKASLEDCFSFLEKAFGSNGENGFALNEFLFRFNQLKKLEKPYPDISQVESICLMLKHDMESFLKSQGQIPAIEKDMQTARETMASLKSIGAMPEKEASALESKMAYFEGFFSGEQLALEKALPVLPDLEKSLGEFLTLLEKKLEDALESEFHKEETLALLKASSSKALFLKKVSLECSHKMDKISLAIKLIESPGLEFSGISISKGLQNLAFSQEGKTVFFSTSCLGKEEIKIFFTVKEPITISLKLESQSTLDGIETSYYSVNLKNRLYGAETLKNVEITLDATSKKNSLKGIELLDSLGKKQKFSIMPNQDIVFTLPSLLPGQETAYFLKVNAEANASVENLSLEEPAPNPLIKAIQNLVSQAEESLSALEKTFSMVSDEEIITSKYIPPITKTELEKAKLKLVSLNSFLENPEEKTIPEKLLEAQSLASRLGQSLSAMEDDAIISYNSAAELYNQENAGEEAIAELESAQENLLNGNFLKSIAESKNAAALVSLQKPQSLDIPIILAPIAAAAILLIAVRLKKKNHAEKRQELVKTIEKNW